MTNKQATWVAATGNRVLTRRKALAMGVATATAFSGLIRIAGAQAVSFDYYVSPSGRATGAGTASDPWPISAINTKQSAIAGKRIGLLDGTYDLSGLVSGWRQTPLLRVPSGSASSPTVIQAVNPRKAILSLWSATGSRTDRPAIGQVDGEGNGNVTIADLVITGGTYCGVSFYYPTQYAPGIRITGCAIYDFARSDADNIPGVWLSGTTDALISNCHIYQISNSGTHNATGVILYGARSTVIEYCTIHDVYAAVYDKHNSGLPDPNQGTVTRFNYIYNVIRVFNGFDNDGGTAFPYKAHYFYNNVIQTVSSAVSIFDPDLFDGIHVPSPIHFYNNTFVAGSLSKGGFQLMALSPGLIHFYNNIFQRSGSAGYIGDLGLASGGQAVLDYNCYQLSGGGSWLLDSKSALGLLAARLLDGSERASVSADPQFVGGSGFNAANFALKSTSPCRGAGRVGGISSGTAVDMGAWGNATRIGHNFGATPVAPGAFNVG